MAATVRPAMTGNQMPGPVPGHPTSPLAVAHPRPGIAPPRPGSTPPSPTTVRQISPTRPLSGFGFGGVGASLRSSASLSRPGRPTISIFGGGNNHNNDSSSGNTVDRRGSLSANLADRTDRGSWSGPSSSASASGSKSSSFIGTPHLSLSRRGSTRDKERERPPLQGPARSLSARGKNKDEESGLRSATSETDARSLLSESEVTETPHAHVLRDPETGKVMVNQYHLMQEIGHGTHGRVRLGRDTNVDASPDDLEEDFATGSGSGPLYAIKIVERNPKKQRIHTLRRAGGNRVAENEIRKEIAIFKKVHHPNVVRMKEIIDDPEQSKLYMILEYCEGGEVRWKSSNGGPALSLAETRYIFRDVLLGLEYLHHQGIIHRDIKPSNLLKSGDKVKIADFGCSHYSEALFAAQGNEGEAYVDDMELAKTAGSPAFFAPEMCYSEVDDVSPPPQSPAPALADDLPTLTLRPPSAIIEKSSNGLSALETVVKIPSDDLSKPEPARTESVNTLPARTKPRHPITNAIDVWALGVTLYCLLFGKTPFDAPNEYLLMQVIPTQQYSIPSTMSSNRLLTGVTAPEEVREALDLLSRLLEKDAMKRITLDEAKRHPFTIRGMQDAQGWIEQTDPSEQTRVTVTNDEVTAAVTRGGLRERFKRHFKSISTRLGFLRRGRSQSVTHDSDPSEYAEGSRAARKGVSHAAESPIAGSNLARRLSLMTRDRSRGGSHGALGAESPRPGLLAAALDRASAAPSPMQLSPSPVIVDDHLHPTPPVETADSTPRQLPSMASLDKIRAEATSSPVGRRRTSTSVDAEHSRPRSTSNASSSGSIFSAIGRGIFSRENSKRGSHRGSNGHAVMKTCHSYGSVDEPDNVFGSSLDSHPPVFSSSVNDSPGAEYLLRRSMDVPDLGLRRRSMETFESESPGSLNGNHLGPSPERLHTFESRFRGTAERGSVPRRGSTLSEDIRPVMEDEEVDWEGDVPDSDDCVSDEEEEEDDGLPAGHGITSAPADWNLAAALEEIERKQMKLSPANSPARAHSLLKPSGGLDLGRLGSKQTLASHTSFASQQSSQSTLSLNQSSTQIRVPPSAYRAKSPLGDTPAYPYSRTSSHGTPHTETGTGPVTTGATTPDCFLDADDDDDGLVLGLRRGRKGSNMSRQSSTMGRSPPPARLLAGAQQ